MTPAIFFQPGVPIFAAECPAHAVTCITVAERFEHKVRSKLAKTGTRGPSPTGRRWPEGPDEGEQAATFRCERPHPALRATLSRREGDFAKGNNILDAAELFASGIFPALVKAGWLRQ